MKTKQLKELIEEHQHLDDEVDKLASQRRLLPSERILLKKLKFKRFYARQKIEKYKKKLDLQ